jgi:hypothetical protein
VNIYRNDKKNNTKTIGVINMSSCVDCGSELKPGTKFCGNCGSPIKNNHENERKPYKGIKITPVEEESRDESPDDFKNPLDKEWSFRDYISGFFILLGLILCGILWLIGTLQGGFYNVVSLYLIGVVSLIVCWIIGGILGKEQKVRGN